MSTLDAEVIVVGLGIHGLAATASLARRGVDVIGIDRFEPGHTRGSSHGRTRMIRRAYPHPDWNELVARAWEGWEHLEAETGAVLVHQTGGLYAHVGAGRLQGPGCRPIEDPVELAELMPSFAVPPGHRAVFDPSAGVIEAERAQLALREVAVRGGARLRASERVDSWQRETDGVRVRTAEGELRARRLIVAGGSWMGALIPALAPLLEVWRILTLTVASGQPAGTAPALGAFSVDRDEGLVFGLPDVAGSGVKLGADAAFPWDPEVPVAPPSAREIAVLRGLLDTYLPGLDSTPLESAACLYTMTADKRFIVGPLAEAPEVIVVSACSGHGFKFGPAIGDAAADLAQGIARPDLDFISTARRGL